MREIKFRVWDGHTKSFFGAEGTHYLPKLECDIDGLLTIALPDETYKIMQYTGLKDKDGKEIYEGDIVEYLDEDLGVVEFGDFGEKDSTPGFYVRDIGMDNHHSIWDGIAAVVGNIYENPELLEKGEEKKGINVPEAHKNIEQMKKLDGDKEFVEIGKLNLNDYVDNLFDRREVSSSTLEVELAIENKINELVNRINLLSKKK